MTIYDIIAKAEALRKETALGAISPERVGLIQTETLKYLNETQIFADALVHKVYADEASFNSDAARLSDLTGRSMKAGQLIYIQSTGNFYRYDGGNQKTLVGDSLYNKIAEIVAQHNGNIEDLQKFVESLQTELGSNNELIEDLQNTKIDKEADDYYPNLSVGLADNLAGQGDATPSEIGFRRSGGGAISDGVARIEAIKGKSVVWNQHSTIFQKAVHYDPSSNKEYFLLGNIPYYVSAINNHTVFAIMTGAPDGYGYLQDNQQADIAKGGKIYVANTSKTNYTNVYLSISPTDKAFDVIISVLFIDLTMMFGAGNEPTTIEEFYSRIPMGVDLNAYNEGEVIHMDVQSIESQGVNAWDEEWEMGSFTSSLGKPYDTQSLRSKNPIKVIPNASYFCSLGKSSGVSLYCYGKDYDFLGASSVVGDIANKTFTIPSNCHYINISIWASYGLTYNHDICINISDASIDGKYFPYIKRVEDLAIIRKYFPQGMKSAGTAHDEIRYNKATQKWEYSQGKIKTLRLADLVWYYGADPGYFYSKDVDNLKSIETTKFNILCDVIVSCNWSNFVMNYTRNKATRIAPYTSANTTRSRVNICNTAYTDVSAFIAWLEEENATLYYESNDWEWVELDAEDQFKDLDYQVWNCGTEKAIAEGKSAPLAADITYGFNAIGKIKENANEIAQLKATMAQMQMAMASVVNKDDFISDDTK